LDTKLTTMIVDQKSSPLTVELKDDDSKKEDTYVIMGLAMCSNSESQYWLMFQYLEICECRLNYTINVCYDDVMGSNPNYSLIFST
jgi:hypothetical protein